MIVLGDAAYDAPETLAALYANNAYSLSTDPVLTQEWDNVVSFDDYGANCDESLRHCGAPVRVVHKGRETLILRKQNGMLFFHDQTKGDPGDIVPSDPLSIAGASHEGYGYCWPKSTSSGI